MWKAPNRPNNEITQSFNDGVLKIYKTINAAPAGAKAVESLIGPAIILRYAEQRTGIARYYAAKQANMQIDRVLRVPRIDGIDTQNVAIDEKGVQFRIEQVQSTDGVYPPCWDLSLSKIAQQFGGDTK